MTTMHVLDALIGAGFGDDDWGSESEELAENDAVSDSVRITNS